MAGQEVGLPGRLSERHFPIFFWLGMALSIVVGLAAERLVAWAAGGLDLPISYGLSLAIGVTVGWRATNWWEAHVPPKSS